MNPSQAIAIGDVQGCEGVLGALLEQADPQRDAPLWFAGDLVNRGPDSLATLRRLRALGDRATVVLGNHDLHCLAVACGARRARRGDTLDALLQAPDATELIDWLRRQALAHHEGPYLMVHAGVFPQWSAEQTRACAAEVEAVLRGPHWGDFLRVMYGNTPDRWDDALSGTQRLRAIVNALTRMRFLDAEGRMNFEAKGDPASAPAGLLPWFEAPHRQTRDAVLIFGHWSTLGLRVEDRLLALDTGCVWGGALTAVRLGDRRVWQQPGTVPAGH